MDIFLTALSMSFDAMTMNAINGMNSKVKYYKLILIAFIFGLFQFLMPTIAYFIGYSFQDVLNQYIPWIGFALLLLLGLKSLYSFIRSLIKKEEIEEKKLSIVTIIVEAIATSIDALCIGFVYLNRTIPDTMFIFSMIGLTTFVTSSIMGLLGSKIGKYLAKYSDLIAAIIFIALAIKTLLDGIL